MRDTRKTPVAHGWLVSARFGSEDETLHRGQRRPRTAPGNFTKTLTWNADGSPVTVAEGSDTLTYVYATTFAYDWARRTTGHHRAGLVRDRHLAVDGDVVGHVVGFTAR
jgi:hypothetical protein